MAALQVKTFETPDETRTFPNGRLDVVQVGALTIARGTFEPGWHWADHIKPIAGTASCQVTHTGYMISGRIGIRMDDGTVTEYGPGDVYFIPPGHDGWVIGDEPAVGFEITGAATFAKPA